MSDQPVGPAHRRVDLGSDSDESSWDGEPKVVVLGEEGDDLGENGRADELPVRVLIDETGADLDLLLELQRDEGEERRGVNDGSFRRVFVAKRRASEKGKEEFTLSTPFRMEPPATPPLRSSTSDPGLLTSNDRMMIILGDEVKSLGGTGIWVQMYSLTASMLYLS